MIIEFKRPDGKISKGYLTEGNKDAPAVVVHYYNGINHAFHNDTTPRYDKAAAELSWKRSMDFFRKYLA